MVYYDLGLEERAREILKAILEGPMEQNDDGSKDMKIRILISYSAFYLDEAIQSVSGQVRDDLFRELRSNLNKSDKIEIDEKTSFVLKGYYFFFLNEVKQAAGYFDNARDTDPTYIPCLVGKVKTHCLIKGLHRVL